jgi:glutamate carboxypeptidase
MPQTITAARVAAVLCALALPFGASPARAEPDKAVLEKAEAHKEPTLAFLKQLVDQDSGSGDEAGLTAVAKMAADELRALGASVETRKAQAPGKADNLVATLEGSGRARIMLMAHMDTVFREGDAAKRPFRIENGRIYGPGVVDDKGGVALGISALKILNELGFKDFATVTLLLNSNEEIGSPGSRALIEEVAKRHDVVLNLEPGRPADGLVIFRKGSGKAYVTVKGKSAHAGVAPDSGRNAAAELAHQVLALGGLGNRETGTTFNFTVLKAGGAANIIPEDAEAVADVRVRTADEFDRVERELREKSQARLIPDTTVTTRLERNFPPMPRNERTDALAGKAQAIYGEIGRKLTLEGSGGAADSSISAGAGVPSIDGLGVVGGEIHTPNEYGEADSVAPRLYLLTRLIMELSRAP